MRFRISLPFIGDKMKKVILAALIGLIAVVGAEAGVARGGAKVVKFSAKHVVVPVAKSSAKAAKFAGKVAFKVAY